MPSVSKKQEKFMQAVANSPKFAKKVGVPQSVGREFTKSGGGTMKKDSKAMAKKEIAFMQKKGAPKSMIKHEKAEYGMKKGGKRYADGGLTQAQLLKALGAPASTTGSLTKTMSGPLGAKPSGMTQTPKNLPRPLPPKGGPDMDRFPKRSGSKTGVAGMLNTLKGMSQQAAGKVGSGPQQAGGRKITPLPSKSAPSRTIRPLPMPPSRTSTMKSGGLAGGHKAADGVAKKGKTRATMVKMAGSKKMMGGGKC